MKISVIVPYYQAVEYVGAALQTVLGQALPEGMSLELIVVMDGPDPSGRALIEQTAPGAIILAHPVNRGPAAARNTGLRHATGDYLAFLDADDLWPEHKLMREWTLLQQPGPGGIMLEAVFGLNQQFTTDATGGMVCEIPEWIFLVGCGLYRSSLIARVGGFDESLLLAEDSDWFFRIWESTNHWLLRFEVALLYRQHGGSLTAHRDRVGPHLRAIHRSMMRRRRRTGQTRPLPPLLQPLRIRHPERRASILLSALRACWQWDGRWDQFILIAESTGANASNPEWTVHSEPRRTGDGKWEFGRDERLAGLTRDTLAPLAAGRLVLFARADHQDHAERIALQVAWHLLFPQVRMSFVARRSGSARSGWHRETSPHWSTLAVCCDALPDMPPPTPNMHHRLFQWYVAERKTGLEPALIPWELVRGPFGKPA